MIDLAQELLKQSKNMLSQAEAGEWELVEKTQQIRSNLIQQLEKEPSAGLSKKESETLAQLLFNSRQLEQMCEIHVRKSQKTLTSEHGKLTKGKAMQKAYGAYRR